MLIAIVNKESLLINRTYEAEEIKDTITNWIAEYVEPISKHVEVPEVLLNTEIKAVLFEGEITLIEDTDKIAAKALAEKEKLVVAARVKCDKDVATEMFKVYGTTSETSSLRSYLTHEKMLAKPKKYLGKLFKDEKAVIEYANKKVDEGEAFSLWCIERIAQRDVEIKSIMEG